MILNKLTIIIDGNVDIDILKQWPGVYQVKSNTHGVVLKIESNDYIQGIFNYAKTCENIMRFEVEQASLSDIFVAKVVGAR